MAKQTSVPFSHWHHLLENLSHSSQAFYNTLEGAIRKRGVPEVSVSRISYREGGILSAKREYLRIKRKNYIFDICAAPFGNSFFTSWWLGETPGGLKELILMIPLIGPLFVGLFKPTTYYQYDVALMFQDSVHAAVIETIDEITKAKGIRALSDVERKPVMNNLFRGR